MERKCENPNCTEIATKRYRTCWRCRQDDGQKRCSSCHNVFEDDTFKTCSKCRARNRAKRQLCIVNGCNGDMIQSGYCEAHFPLYEQRLAEKNQDVRAPEVKKILQRDLFASHHLNQKMTSSDSSSDESDEKFEKNQGTNQGAKMDLERRIKISHQTTGKNSEHTQEDFEEVRELLSQKMTKKSIAEKMGFNKDLVLEISRGLLHADELASLSDEDKKVYAQEYTIPHFERNAEKRRQKTDEELKVLKSTVRRVVKDIDIQIEIFMYKFKINPKTQKLYTAQSVADHYQISIYPVKNSWSKPCLQESEFNDTLISFERYQELAQIQRNLYHPEEHISQIPELNDLPTF